MAKTAIITGGSRGIGAALVRELAGQGYRVLFTYRRHREDALALARETGAVPLRCDASREADARILYEYAMQQLGHIDALVLNAGISYSGLLQDTTAARWDALHRANLRGAFLTLREFIPHMVSRGGGGILLVSSVWGVRGAACEAAYAASKAGLIGLGLSLAAELGPSGVRVNVLAPGVVRTAMLEGYTAEELEDLRRRTLLGRLGSPADIAKAASFLLGEAASYITGQVLSVDGGFR